MITDLITLLQKDKYYGAGPATEIAKGQNEVGYTWRKIKRKLYKIRNRHA